VLTGTINDKNTTFVTKTEQQHGHFVASWEARDKELVSAVPMDRLVPVFPIYSGPSLEEHLDVGAGIDSGGRTLLEGNLYEGT